MIHEISSPTLRNWASWPPPRNFPALVSIWRSLTSEQHQAYNIAAKKYRMTGYNYFLKKAISFTYANYGFSALGVASFGGIVD